MYDQLIMQIFCPFVLVWCWLTEFITCESLEDSTENGGLPITSRIHQISICLNIVTT